VKCIVIMRICQSVCLFGDAFLCYCMYFRVTLENGSGCIPVVHLEIIFQPVCGLSGCGSVCESKRRILSNVCPHSVTGF